MTQAAYVLRIAPGGDDKVSEALASDKIIIGWTNAGGLLDDSLSWEQFREIRRAEYYPDEANLRRAGAAAGHMWKFICNMKQLARWDVDLRVERRQFPARGDRGE